MLMYTGASNVKAHRWSSVPRDNYFLLLQSNRKKKKKKRYIVTSSLAFHARVCFYRHRHSVTVLTSVSDMCKINDKLTSF